MRGVGPVDPERLGAAVRGIRDAMREAPRELALTLVKPPPMGPDIPPMVEVVWAGDDEGAKHLQAQRLRQRGQRGDDLFLFHISIIVEI